MALERVTTPKRSRRACSPRYRLQSCQRGWAGVAKRRRELTADPNPLSPDSQFSHRCVHLTLLQVNTTLTRLDLSNNPGPGDAGLERFAQMLHKKHHQSLVTIILNRINMSDKALFYLTRALCSNHTLTTMHLARNRLGDSAAACIGALLSENMTLTELDLSWNVIKSAGELPGDAKSSLGDAKCSLGDAKCSLGDV
jgi:hypothetical protein